MKRGLILFVILVFLLSIFPIVYSQNLPGQDQIEALQRNVDTLTNPQSSTDYLKQEWTKIIQDTSFGKNMIQFGQFLTTLNPIFNLILGLGFSWSWIFFLTLALWICFLIWVYRLSFFTKLFVSSRIVQFFVFIFLMLFISYIEISKLISLLFVNLISNIDSLFFQLISAFVFLMIILILTIYSRVLSKAFKVAMEKREKKNLEKKVKKDELDIRDQKRKSSEDKDKFYKTFSDGDN